MARPLIKSIAKMPGTGEYRQDKDAQKQINNKQTVSLMFDVGRFEKETTK